MLIETIRNKEVTYVNPNQAKKNGSQFNAMLDDVLLLFDDLVLLWMVHLGSRDAGGYSGVQRANTVSTPCELLQKLQLSSLTVRWVLLPCKQTTSTHHLIYVGYLQLVHMLWPTHLPRLDWRFGLTYMSLLHSTIHLRMDTRHSKPFLRRLSSCDHDKKDSPASHSTTLQAAALPYMIVHEAHSLKPG